MLSRQSLDILIDLVEIKLSTILIQDKDDIREVRRLKHCRNELVMLRRAFSKAGCHTAIAKGPSNSEMQLDYS